MANTQYTRLDEKIDRVLAKIGDMREDVAVLKDNRTQDCIRLENVAKILENLNGRVRKNERNINRIVGVGSGIVAAFGIAKAWLKI